MSRTFATIVLCSYFGLLAIVAAAKGATVTTLHRREHRQARLLHRYEGTLRFFHNHHRLARTVIGRREVHRARIWVRVLLVQLRRTRVALRPRPVVVQDWLYQDFLCIHHYEGAWNDNTGNGYYGGLQMDFPFMAHYGAEYLARYGPANNWPPVIQILVAERAYRSGRGFGPWPNTARACGLPT